MTKIKKSFRLPAEIVLKIEESGNESEYVEQAVRGFTGKQVENIQENNIKNVRVKI